ncbi:MAG: hypothetical protein WD063_14685 [Pirellulales bacterium]
MPVAMRACVLCFALLAAGGCRLAEPGSANKSPLAPLTISPDSITLEVFSAPALHGDPQFAELWELVDEQPLPAELRRRLAANGMRAGLVGPNVPGALAAVLKVSDRRIEEEKRQLVSMDPEGGVTLRVLHAQAGKRIELAIPRVRDEMSLLEAVDGRIQGKTYRKAECRLALRAFPQSDGRVRLELTPEVHYGEFKSQRRGSDGVFIWTQERDKKIFGELKLEPALAPGQMLLVTCRPERSGTAGWHFFTDVTGDKPVATLWVLRVAGAAPDRAFYDGRAKDELPAVSNDQ